MTGNVPPSEVSSTRSTNWRAWIWWNNAWNRLSTISLPIYDEAFMEEYVEVYRDPNVTGHFNLPSTDIDNVQVKESPGSSSVYWRNPPISTVAGSSIAPYCLSGMSSTTTSAQHRVDWNG